MIQTVCTLTPLDLLRAASDLYDAGDAREPIEAIDVASRTLHAPAAVEVAAMNYLAVVEAQGWDGSDALVCACIDAQGRVALSATLGGKQ